ncbi:hypothetical protein KGR00_07185 [Halomonas coralii]|nr:hypothetical protein [Modicisalibacter sp. MOD 31.J]
MKGGKDLASRRPYPNKRYVVACRKVGRKAITGFLIQAPDDVRWFSATARWAIGATIVVRHVVRYEIIDSDYDAVSDDMLLWGPTPKALGNWPSRWPDFTAQWPAYTAQWTPANAQPCMEVTPTGRREGDVRDTVEGGLILYREERLGLPTIESGRLLEKELSVRHRLPEIKSAFDTRG